MRPWHSQPPHNNWINGGDEVYLFCHSMCLGLFRDPDTPPRVASPVCQSTNPDFLTQIKTFSPAKTWFMSHGYDEGETNVLTHWFVLASRLAGTAVAVEAAAQPPTEPRVMPWLGAFDNEAEDEAAAKIPPASNWPAFLISAGFSYPGHDEKYLPAGFRDTGRPGSRITSDMLARMAKDGFEPARFKVRFVLGIPAGS
jgi:hypothetical protein